MTRDEARAICFAAMKRAVPSALTAIIADWWLDQIIQELFDSLHGIVTVNLPEATVQMIEAAVDKEYPSAMWRSMAARGNLTTPREKRP